MSFILYIANLTLRPCTFQRGSPTVTRTSLWARKCYFLLVYQVLAPKAINLAKCRMFLIFFCALSNSCL